MFAWWGTVIGRLRWLVLVLTLGFVAFSGVWGIGVFDALSDDSSLDNPASESQRINERVLAEVGPQNTDFIALYSSDTLSVEDPRFRGAVEAVATRLQASPAVDEVNSYYSTGSPSMVSTDKRQTYLAIRLSSEASDDD